MSGWTLRALFDLSRSLVYFQRGIVSDRGSSSLSTHDLYASHSYDENIRRNRRQRRGGGGSNLLRSWFQLAYCPYYFLTRAMRRVEDSTRERIRLEGWFQSQSMSTREWGTTEVSQFMFLTNWELDEIHAIPKDPKHFLLAIAHSFSVVQSP